MLQAAPLEREEVQFLKVATLTEEYFQNETIASGQEESLRDLIMSPLFKKASHFHYHDRIRFAFSVTSEFRPLFIMLKGLIEFHRPKNFVFSYNTKERTIETDIHTDDTVDLQVFFDRVLLWLKHENQFRHGLKLALEFENRYRVEMDRVYGIVKSVSVAAQRS